MPLQVVIADDEVLARQKLLQLLREEPDIEVVGEGANAAETIDLVQLRRPDVLLLDIRMPGMDGFDVISALSCSSPPSLPSIIFTTAHDQYALQAFEVHAVDYLLKPFTRERLSIALDHAREQQERRRANGPVKSAQKKEYTKRLFFALKGESFSCPLRRYAGLARKKITCGFARVRRAICCAIPWPISRPGWILKFSCGFIALRS